MGYILGRDAVTPRVDGIEVANVSFGGEAQYGNDP